MHRSFVLVLALMLTGGTNVALLCRAWCDPSVAAATGCHVHESSADSAISATSDCDDSGLDEAVMVGGDAGRSSSTPYMLPASHPLAVAEPPVALTGLRTRPYGPSCDRPLLVLRI